MLATSRLGMGKLITFFLQCTTFCDLAEAQVLDEGVDAPLGVAAAGEGARLPQEGVEEEGLTHGHVVCERDVLLYEGHAVLEPRRAAAEQFKSHVTKFSVLLHNGGFCNGCITKRILLLQAFHS